MRKVLVIEDNLEIRENLEELLVLEGYIVSTASNGSAGVETALRERPDLILCDVTMPELDGFGVLAQLRENESMALVPFIFLTAKAEKTDMHRGLSEGANDYLIKPFTAEQLLTKIAGCIKTGM